MRCFPEWMVGLTCRWNYSNTTPISVKTKAEISAHLHGTSTGWIRWRWMTVEIISIRYKYQLAAIVHIVLKQIDFRRRKNVIVLRSYYYYLAIGKVRKWSCPFFNIYSTILQMRYCIIFWSHAILCG